MGAMIALEAVLRYPERFTGLVIVDGRYSGVRSPMRDKLIAGCKQNFAETMDAFVEACIPEIGGDAERAWGKLELKRATAKEAVEILECVEHVNIELQLHKILIPTLIRHGRKDVICPLASSEKLHQSLTNSTLVVHDDAGHVRTITYPEWVAEQISSSNLFL
jgi:3-oxoadipate enol-lactonase